MPKNSKAKIDANRRYTEKSYDRLYPFVPKGRKTEIQAAADAVGETLNEFIVKAIDERMERIQRKREAEMPFVPPPGESCTKECKKRCKMIPAVEGGSKERAKFWEPDVGVPWCSMYGKEITDNKKCVECLQNMKAIPAE